MLRTVELERQGSGADVVLVDALAVEDSKHQELSWHDLDCISSLACSRQAIPSSKPGKHSITAASRSAQGVCDQYKP